MVTLDWLQLNCVGKIPESVLSELEVLPYSTRVFKSIARYVEAGDEQFVIAFNPASSILDPYTHLIKFNNKLLYSPNLRLKVAKVLEVLNLELKGLSRLDIALDFNKFLNNLDPQSLIQHFVTGKFLNVGRADWQLRGSNSIENRFQYLRFGNPNSELSVYIYNKTLELQSVKDKPYIRDSWSQQQLDQTVPIWRIEFSMKGNRLRTVDNATGQVDKLDINNIFDPYFMHNFYYSLLDKHFRFVRNDGKGNISRMKVVKLFNNKFEKLITFKETEKKESDRSVRIFIKKMEEFNSIMREIKKSKTGKESAYYPGEQVLENAIDLYDLSDFYERKIRGLFD